MIWAIIKIKKSGFHKWSKAPKEVMFLRGLHRHIFCIELWIQQKHTARDIEYFIEKRKLGLFLDGYFKDKDDESSCEDIASVIMEEWQSKYPDRKIKVGVWEDNENGTLIE